MRLTPPTKSLQKDRPVVREPLRTFALAEALTKGELRALEWAVNRARRDSDAFGTKPENALSAIRKLKQPMGTPGAETDLMSVKEQRGLAWAVERATKDSDGYVSETGAARRAIAKLHATSKFEQEAHRGAIATGRRGDRLHRARALHFRANTCCVEC